jgi:hypothetical protein
VLGLIFKLKSASSRGQRDRLDDIPSDLDSRPLAAIGILMSFKTPKTF